MNFVYPGADTKTLDYGTVASLIDLISNFDSDTIIALKALANNKDALLTLLQN